jgi:tryptophan synthase beta chain
MSTLDERTGPTHRPDARGRFGAFGGRYVPETVMAALDELEAAFEEALADPAFHAERAALLRDYVGRETPIYHAVRLSGETRGAEIWFKREDLNHTGAHKINNAVGQALIARRLGKRRIVAETGAGQHGVATATVCALFGLDAVVYMGEEDIRRQAPNVTRMRLLGAEVVPVRSGAGTLKDAMNEAIRDWIATVESTHYMIGSAAGPHPYPLLVRELQRVIGDEARAQFLERKGVLPDAVVACVGGGSNAIGMFHAFRDDSDVRLVGVEAGGDGAELHARSIGGGRVSILHGSRSYVLADGDGQVQETHSISAGLDYPGVGPEHSMLAESGRVEYVGETDAEALEAFHDVCRLEGIIPALESSHAVSRARRLAVEIGADGTVLVCLSGRGDKDVQTVLDAEGDPAAAEAPR